MNLRMAGLSAAVLFTVLLPLAASAVTSDTPDSVSSDAKSGESLLSDGLSAEHGEESAVERAGEKPEVHPADGSKDGSAESLTESAGRNAPETSPPGLLSESGLPFGAGGTDAPAARCGPELTSPEGVEAQTCVMAEGRDVWARTYYRNTTGEQLRSFLTLMGPGGRAVELRCEVEAHDEPGVCETPRAPAHGAVGAYTAVAEYAGGGAADEAPLLLRTGSNLASPPTD
ncbi:hypothetical protein [Streptomyces sp. NPDC055749]